MSSDLYQELILDHYQHPHHQGNLSGPGVLSASEKNVGCGDEFTVQLSLDETGTIIIAIKWQGQGCAISTAALSVLSDFVLDKKITQVLALQPADVLELLGLEEINPGREKCLTLGLRAIQRVISSQG